MGRTPPRLVPLVPHCTHSCFFKFSTAIPQTQSCCEQSPLQSYLRPNLDTFFKLFLNSQKQKRAIISSFLFFKINSPGGTTPESVRKPIYGAKHKMTICMKCDKGTGDEKFVSRTSSSIWAMLQIFLLILQCKSDISTLAGYCMLRTVLHHCMCSVKKIRRTAYN